MLHFVKGDLIFTDGSRAPGYYKTTRVDEKSTQYSTVNTQIYVEPGIDFIRILDKTGGIYVEVPESDDSNLLTAVNKGEGGEAFAVVQTNGVIHQIDKVLRLEELDTNE
jgi:hypothetical protein